MKRTVIIYVVLLLIILTGGCAEKEAASDIFAMDTLMSFTLYGTQQDMKDIQAEIYRLDEKFSTEKEESIVYQLNHQERTELDDETLDLFQAAQEMKRETNGAFDISLGAVSRRWGFFNREYEKEGYTIPEDEEITSLLEERDSYWLEGSFFIRKAGQLDFGACIKGYASDRVMQIIKEKGISGAVFSLGGNVCTVGKKRDGSPWRIAVRDPEEGYLGSLESRDEAIVTSGAYQRYFEKDGIRYHHILNPDTGKPADSGLISVTAVSGSGLAADMLSTAVFVMGLGEAEEFYKNHEGFELILKDEMGKLYITQGLQNRFIPESNDTVHIIKRG